MRLLVIFTIALLTLNSLMARKPTLFVQERKVLKTSKTTARAKTKVRTKKTQPKIKTILSDQQAPVRKRKELRGIYSDITAYYRTEDQEEEEEYREQRTGNSKGDLADMGGDIKSVMRKHHFTLGSNPHSVQGVPIIYTSKSTGFNLGARISLANLKDEDPYTYKFSVQYWASDRGSKKHEIALDMPHFFSKSWHARMAFKYPKTITQKYYGAGNDSVNDKSLIDPDSPNFLSRTYYQYIETYPKFTFDLQYKVIGNYLSIYSGIAIEKATIRPHNNDQRSKIYTEQPYGYGGGKTNYVKGGLRFDTRDYPFNPTSGVTIAATYTNHGKFIKSDYPYSNINLVYMGFLSFWRYFTLSQRFMVDQMWGDLPFFSLSEFRSYNDYDGLGGEDFLRGAPSYRYVDNLKFANQFELRTRVYNGKVFGQMLMIHFNPFWDMGRVWDRKEKISITHFHHSFGNEFRFTWNKDFIMSFTMGKSGSGFATYLTFGESFM